MSAEKNPLTWDTETTAKWLQATFQLSEEILQRFRENDIDGSILVNDVGHPELKDELGITSFGLRCNILKQIRNLQPPLKSEDPAVKHEKDETTTVYYGGPQSPVSPGGQSRSSEFTTGCFDIQLSEESKEIPLFKVPLQVWRSTPGDLKAASVTLSQGHKDADEILLSDSDGMSFDGGDCSMEDDGTDRGNMKETGYYEDTDDDVPLAVRTKAKKMAVPSSLGMSDTQEVFELQQPKRKGALAPQEHVATRIAIPPTAQSKRVTPTLVSTSYPPKTLGQEPSLTSISSTSASASTPISVSRGTTPVLQDLEPTRHSPSNKSLNTTDRFRSHRRNRQQYCSHALDLCGVFFNEDLTALETDNEDDWSMPSAKLPRGSVPMTYKRAIQAKLKRILRTPPIFNTPGHTVYAPMERKENDVPVRLLSPSGTEKESTISTSTWDTVFKSDKKSPSIRVEVDLNGEEATSINFRALTSGGDAYDLPKQGLGFDPILPLYGDSDASAYTTDEELYQEVAKEERERLGKSNSRGVKTQSLIPRDIIQETIDEHKADHRGHWMELQKPQLDKQRFQTYQGLMWDSKFVSPVDSLTEYINRLSDVRLPSLISALIGTPFKSKDEVRKACKAMDETLTQLWELQWKLELVQGPAPPPDTSAEDSSGRELTPKTTSVVIHPRRESANQGLSSEDEALLEEEERQQELDEAFIDDSEFFSATEDGFQHDDDGDIFMGEHTPARRKGRRTYKGKGRAKDTDDQSSSFPSPTSTGTPPQSVHQSPDAEYMDTHRMEPSEIKRQQNQSEEDSLDHLPEKLSGLRSGTISPDYVDLDNDSSSNDDGSSVAKVANTTSIISTFDGRDGEASPSMRNQAVKEVAKTRSTVTQGDSHDNPLELDESISVTDSEDSTTEETSEVASLESIKPLTIPDWREKFQDDDDALIQELRKMRKLMSVG
ncbi:hypothetical protein BGZ65_002505, partial [Modicella reniformis]